MADFLYRRVEMSATNIDELFDLWALSMTEHDDFGPFSSYKHMYEAINATKLVGPNEPAWKSAVEVWYRDPDIVIRNMLDNPEFDGSFDYTPYIRRDSNGARTWSDFMSGNYAWKHAWTGDDSKALMKVYLSAIAGHVPAEMVQAISAFMDACYIVRREDITEASLNELEAAVRRFHHHREIFRTTGVRPTGFNLPRQHALSHYRHHIEQFGAPNGLCSTITESRHITAVKKPWRRSNRYEALGQMLLTNQRLDKLAASRADFVSRNMLKPTCLPPPTPLIQDLIEGQLGDDDAGPIDEYVTGNVSSRAYPRDLDELAAAINQPQLPDLLRRFLFDQLNKDDTISSNTVPLDACPLINGDIKVFHSAITTFYAPSDNSGIRGMRRERIRSTPCWREKEPRRDCALVVEDEQKPGMKGLGVVRVQLFFSFHHESVTYPSPAPDSEGEELLEIPVVTVEPSRIKFSTRRGSTAELDGLVHLVDFSDAENDSSLNITHLAGKERDLGEKQSAIAKEALDKCARLEYENEVLARNLKLKRAEKQIEDLRRFVEDVGTELISRS
ncbi:hypothetical protein DXG03_000990, partial [Asterophora parasitica]